jgi:hypothetical protein
MKVCPKCQNKYEDETLNFCLDDGSVLTLYNDAEIDPPATVFMGPANQTDINPQFGTNQNWQPSTSSQVSGTGNSRSMLWVIGIVLGVILLCGGGGVLGLFIIGTIDDNSDSPRTEERIDSNGKDEKNESGDSSRKLVTTLDFSNVEFENTKSIKINLENNKLQLRTIDDYFYVFIFGDFKSANASIKLTVENSSGRASTFGYGLVINSYPDKAIESGYAFLIDSVKGEYRFVRHSKQVETEIVKWTKSSAINKGTRPNDIEARIYDKNVKLYINGIFIRSEKMKSINSSNVAGVYTSDSIPITFSNMELRK